MAIQFAVLKSCRWAQPWAAVLLAATTTVVYGAMSRPPSAAQAASAPEGPASIEAGSGTGCDRPWLSGLAERYLEALETNEGPPEAHLGRATPIRLNDVARGWRG